MYGQLMLHMLKRGVLEGPFTSKPQEGSLPTLPTYMVCTSTCRNPKGHFSTVLSFSEHCLCL